MSKRTKTKFTVVAAWLLCLVLLAGTLLVVSPPWAVEDARAADLKETSTSLLSSTTVSLGANADTVLYTVPTGVRLVLSHAYLIAGADAVGSDISIGQNGATTDFIPAYDLQHLDAEFDVVLLKPIPAVEALQLKSYAAGTVIEATVTNQAGGATNTLQLFGTLY